VAVQAQAFLGDQVDRDALFQQFDVGTLSGFVEQGSENRCARGVGGVNDAPMAVTAFAGQMELEPPVLGAGLLIAGKGYALIDKPLNGFFAVLDGKAHSIFVAQAAAGVEGVIDVGLNGIGVVQNGSDTALSPECRAIGEVALAQYGDTQMIG